jgi:hypothetical protein
MDYRSWRQPRKDLQIVFKPNTDSFIETADFTVSNIPKSVRTNTSGFFYVDLIKSSVTTVPVGLKYYIRNKEIPLNSLVTIPDVDSIELKDLI